jgi:hypothetical protein
VQVGEMRYSKTVEAGGRSMNRNRTWPTTGARALRIPRG